VVLQTLEHSRNDQIKYIGNQLQSTHVSQLVQAYDPRLFAQAQLEETRHDIVRAWGEEGLNDLPN
jgi:hypothetical protein